MISGLPQPVRFGVIAVLWAAVMWRPEFVVGPLTGNLLLRQGMAAVLYLYSVLLVTVFGRRAIQVWLVFGAAVSVVMMDGLTVGRVVLFVVAVLAALRFVMDLVWQVFGYDVRREAERSSELEG